LGSEAEKAILEALSEHELRGKPGEVAKYKALLSILNMLRDILDMLRAVLQEGSKARSCLDCKWLVKKSLRLGCYYKGQIKKWHPKERAPTSVLQVEQSKHTEMVGDTKSWAEWEAVEKA